MAQQDGGAAPAQEPAEGAMIRDLLSTLGIKQHDARVVDCLMDLTYRATSDILQDAEAINAAAGGNGATLAPQDIALAAAQHARVQPHAPSMQELHALARKVNAQPLTGPSDKQHGIKLPPVADCLLSQHYQLKPRQKPQAPPAGGAAAGAAGQPPRQHYAVKQQHGRIGLSIPQQWQPPADAAGAAAEPFAPPATQPAAEDAAGDAAQQQAAGGPQAGQAMEVDTEVI